MSVEEINLEDLNEAQRRTLRLPGSNSNIFNARKVRADGYTFASVDEWRRYEQLKLMQAAGEIAHLEVHPKFKLDALDGTYTADFDYVTAAGDYVIEDVKGMKHTTEAYRLRVKALHIQYGYHVTEVRLDRDGNVTMRIAYRGKRGQ